MTVPVLFVWADHSKRPMLFGCKVEKLGETVQIKQKLQELTGIPAERMAATDVWRHKITREIKDKKLVMELSKTDNVVVYELEEARPGDLPPAAEPENDTETPAADDPTESADPAAPGAPANGGSLEDDDDDIEFGPQLPGQSARRALPAPTPLNVPDRVPVHIFHRALVKNPHYFPSSAWSKEFIEDTVGLPFVVMLPTKNAHHRQRKFAAHSSHG
eukprot:GABV01001205.1.p1 GENE.GABV01001205.1~~GABV01001205.1.p1  ORF type:complete len:217 (-),score=86.20 GABV01001205.1:11-661(-)